jgi:hypothetical protein
MAAKSPTRDDSRAAVSERATLGSWLAKHGRPSVAFIDHSDIDGYDFGAPLVDRDACERLKAPMRARLTNIVAVERSIYAGLRSTYAIRRTGDLVALLTGLAHGWTPAALRLDRASLERCVEHDAWRIAGCEYWESRGGSWRSPPAALRAALDGKRDGRAKWSAQLFAQSAPIHGGFSDYRLTLVALPARRSNRASRLELEIGCASEARDAAGAVAEACGRQLPRGAHNSARTRIPSFLWPDGRPASRTTLTRVQWAKV